MDRTAFHELYDFSGKVAVVTGGAGTLCAVICRMLASLGAKVAVLDLDAKTAESLASDIAADGGQALSLECDVLLRTSIEKAAARIRSELGPAEILVNGAGGNRPEATTSEAKAFFDLPVDALRWVLDLNLIGTILPSQVFGKAMAAAKRGAVLNIASMNAYRPLTRIPAYSAAKAAVSNFTQWMAVHMAQEYSPDIRVNAIAPGFFVTEQNRYLLTERESGAWTTRGRSIVQHTPMGRFGEPQDLLGAAMWLISPAASFVTGVVIPVDGGFSAFSGV